MKKFTYLLLLLSFSSFGWDPAPLFSDIPTPERTEIIKILKQTLPIYHQMQKEVLKLLHVEAMAPLTSETRFGEISYENFDDSSWLFYSIKPSSYRNLEVSFGEYRHYQTLSHFKDEMNRVEQIITLLNSPNFDPSATSLNAFFPIYEYYDENYEYGEFDLDMGINHILRSDGCSLDITYYKSEGEAPEITLLEHCD